MILSGLQKSTLIDYPWKLAAVVFTTWCNLRCGFCHNPEMVVPDQIMAHKSSQIPERIFFNFLERRKNILDGISICGWEPTIHRDLPSFCRAIKERWFLVKIDTNWQNPDMLDLLIKEDIVDYIAMDIKHTWKDYSALVGMSIDRAQYEKSIELIMSWAKDYEFRSTIIEGVHTEGDIREMLSYIAGSKIYFLQNYRSGITLDPWFVWAPFFEKELRKYQSIAREYVKRCEIRM